MAKWKGVSKIALLRQLYKSEARRDIREELEEWETQKNQQERERLMRHKMTHFYKLT
jgi:hypothetical protein